MNCIAFIGDETSDIGVREFLFNVKPAQPGSSGNLVRARLFGDGAATPGILPRSP
jgi:hypothetical protein